MKVFCNLTKEQATLYAAVVKEADKSLEESEGIKRKGVVLARMWGPADWYSPAARNLIRTLLEQKN